MCGDPDRTETPGGRGQGVKQVLFWEEGQWLSEGFRLGQEPLSGAGTWRHGVLVHTEG